MPRRHGVLQAGIAGAMRLASVRALRPRVRFRSPGDHLGRSCAGSCSGTLSGGTRQGFEDLARSGFEDLARSVVLAREHPPLAGLVGFVLSGAG